MPHLYRKRLATSYWLVVICCLPIGFPVLKSPEKRQFGAPRETPGFPRASVGCGSRLLTAGIEPGSPASRAGLWEADIIVAFEGGPVPGIHALHRHLVARPIEISSNITVIRRTEKLELVVKPEELTTDNQKN